MAKRRYDQLPSEGDHRALLESQIRALPHVPYSLTDAAIREIVDSIDPAIESIPSITTNKEAARAVSAVFDAGTELCVASSEAIWRWVKKNPKERIPILERMAALHIEDGGNMTLSLFSLLGRLDKDRPHFLVEDECARALAVANAVPQIFFNQLSVMDRIPDVGARVVTHRIFDFVRTYIRSMQNDAQRTLGSDSTSLGVFAEQFFVFLNNELPHITNYLLAKHGTDIFEMKNFLRPHKESALPGVPGGAEDETIYTHTHAAESYVNRIKLGIAERSLLARPALACASGLIAVYKNGRIDRMYRGVDMPSTQTPDSVWIEKANPVGAYNGVYDELNASPERFRGSRGLQKLKILWKFFPNRQPFFFDVSRIDMETLHPLVRAEIYLRNEEFVRMHPGANQQAVPSMTQREFEAQLFPYPSRGTQAKMELYLQFSSISMRKKIEEGFGISYADLNMWTQRNFLTYLEEQPIERIREIQMFVIRFGNDGLASFLATEDDPAFGATLITIGERFGTAALPIFARYAELANAAYAAGDAVREQYGNTRDISEPTIHAIQNNILKAGKALLIQLAQSEPKHGTDGEPLLPDSVWRAYERISAGAILFASTFQQLRGQGVDVLAMENTEFLALLGGQDGGIEEDERHAMIRTTDDNYPPIAEVGENGYSDEFRDERITELREALDNPTTMFYLYKHENGDVIAFCRFDILAKGRLRFASMHVNPQYQGNKIGEALIQKTVDNWARDHVIEAHCDARTSIVRHYIEHGFVGIGCEPSHLGVPALSLERDDRTPYESKQFTAPEIIQRSRRHEEGDDIIVEEYQSTDQFSRLNDVYVLTRFSRAGEKEYCVFETKY